MEIRSITLFAEPTFDPGRSQSFFRAAGQVFPVAVQSMRIALPPLPSWWNPRHFTASQAKDTARHWIDGGVNYISLGPVQLRHDAGWLNRLPEIIASNETLFVSAEITDTNGLIDVGRCHALASIIRRVSTLQPDGFANLYLAALANCPAGTPFFPAAYHHGGSPHFALAIEGADLALKAISAARTLTEARLNLVEAIERAGRQLAAVAGELAAAHELAFSGLDFSLAPAPGETKSLAGAMEALGLAWLGAPGSLFSAAFIAEALDRANFPRCGFSGLMLPVLEDSVVATRAGQERVKITDLLNYAAVCGLGLDTVPLPGDVGQDVLAGILLDVAALATRLNKPLTARLMPLPGLRAGDPVEFDFPYFAGSRVMDPGTAGVSGLLESTARLPIGPHPGRRVD